MFLINHRRCIIETGGSKLLDSYFGQRQELPDAATFFLSLRVPLPGVYDGRVTSLRTRWCLAVSETSAVSFAKQLALVVNRQA